MVARLALYLFALAAIAACRSERPEVIRIGAVSSLSGPAAEQGKNWVDGARLAAHELNGRGIRCELVVEDDATTPGKAVSALRKLVVLNKVSAVIGGTWDYLAESSFPVAYELAVPFVTVTNPVELLSHQAKANPYAFTSAMTVAAEIEAMRPLLKSLKPKSIALVYPNLPWGTAHAEAVERLAEELGLPVVYREAFPFEGYLDALRVSALRVKEANAELIYSPIEYNGILVLANELNVLKIEPYLLVSQHLDAALATSPEKKLLRRVYGVYPAVDETRFDAAYESMFHHEHRVYAAAGYDAMNFLVLAAVAGVEMAAPGAQFEYQGVTGRHALPPKGRALAETKAVITMVRGDQMVRWPH